MVRFREKYFSKRSETACELALKTHVDLRHRNAHPDWLTAPNGVLSKDELKQSTRDLVFMSRFYGYMILAMAGFKEMEPLFPNVIFSNDFKPSIVPGES